MFQVYKSASNVTLCAQNSVTWPTIFHETGNLPSSACTSILIALLCMPRTYRQNLMKAFSCDCLYPELLLKSWLIGSLSNCSVYGYHASEPYVRIGSTKLSKSCMIAPALIFALQ